MIDYSHANKDHIHKKVFVALSLVLVVRVLETRKWPISRVIQLKIVLFMKK